MHAHALRKGTGAYGHFCPSPLQHAPSVYPTPCSHRQRDWALPQARGRSSYHAQRNLSAVVSPVFLFLWAPTQKPSFCEGNPLLLSWDWSYGLGYAVLWTLFLLSDSVFWLV